MRSIVSAIEVVLAVGVLALAACDQGYPKTSDRDRGKAVDDNAVIMAKMLEYKALMCACKDAACAERVGNAMTHWSEQLAKQQTVPPNMNAADTKRATAITEATFECWTRELAPKWFSLEPDQGDAIGGTSVKLMAASQFTDDDAKTARIYFGGKLGKVIRVVSSEELLVEAPGGTAGETVDVVLELQGTDREGREEVPHSFRFVTKN
jgi:hypothetical protein